MIFKYCFKCFNGLKFRNLASHAGLGGLSEDSHQICAWARRFYLGLLSRGHKKKGLQWMYAWGCCYLLEDWYEVWRPDQAWGSFLKLDCFVDIAWSSCQGDVAWCSWQGDIAWCSCWGNVAWCSCQDDIAWCSCWGDIAWCSCWVHVAVSLMWMHNCLAPQQIKYKITQ